MAPENVAELRDIRQAFGNDIALDRVSLSLRGGVTGLLGPNGAGKSTLLRVLATGLEPDSGVLELFGEPIDHGSKSVRSARRSIGFMPQQAAVYSQSRVDDFLTFIALLKEIEPKAARAAEVDRVLAVTDLAGRRRSRIKALSGGMRQRVSLASSLLGSPGLLILDEPTVGLDPEQRIRFREAISQVSRDCAVVLSTHQTDDVALLCNRVIVLQEGSVKFQGTTRALADLARGHVWVSDQPSDRSIAAWLTGDGMYRCVGNPADGEELVEPTIDDGYLWLTQVSRPKVIQ